MRRTVLVGRDWGAERRTDGGYGGGVQSHRRRVSRGRGPNRPSRSVVDRVARVVPVVGCVVLALTASGCSDGEWQGPLGALGQESVVPTATPEPSASSSGVLAGGASPAAADAGAQSSSGPSASPTPDLVPSPTTSQAVLVPPDLAEVEGYTYAKAPKAVAKAFTPVAAGYNGVLSAPTVRAVRRSGTDIGSAAAMTVEPASWEDSEVVSTLVTGLVQGMSGKGYTLRTRAVTVDGEKRTVVVAFRKGSTIGSWLHKGCVVAFVSSEPEETALRFARAYLAG